MATTATFQIAHSGRSIEMPAWRAALALLVCAGMPLGVFGLVQLGAESLGIMPLYFTPFGLPAWTGSLAHILQLALLGAAYWAVIRRSEHSSARHWLVALTATYIILPFVTPYLDMLMLAFACTALLLLAAATMLRAGAVSKLAGWLVSPMLLLVGLSAALGLAVAAYAPPFALMQTQQPPPAA